MKQVIYLFVLLISLALSACGGSSDNTSVKEIVSVVNTATETNKRVAQEEASGARQFGELHDDEVFITPNGNIFANDSVLAIIKAEPDYKLTDADKEMLLTAISAYFGNDTFGLSVAKDAIKKAKTLNDLYKFALANEAV